MILGSRSACQTVASGAAMATSRSFCSVSVRSSIAPPAVAARTGSRAAVSLSSELEEPLARVEVRCVGIFGAGPHQVERGDEAFRRLLGQLVTGLAALGEDGRG